MALTYATFKTAFGNYSLNVTVFNCHAMINWNRGKYLCAGYIETGSRLEQYQWH